MEPNNTQPPEFIDPNTVVPDGTPTYVAPAPDSQAAEVGEKTGAETNYINPNQVNTMGTNAVKMGGKAWVWWTMAGVVTTLVILLAGTYYFYKVKGANNTSGRPNNSAVLTNKQSNNYTSDVSDLFNQLTIHQVGPINISGAATMFSVDAFQDAAKQETSWGNDDNGVYYPGSVKKSFNIYSNGSEKVATTVDLNLISIGTDMNAILTSAPNIESKMSNRKDVFEGKTNMSVNKTGDGSFCANYYDSGLGDYFIECTLYNSKTASDGTRVWMPSLFKGTARAEGWDNPNAEKKFNKDLQLTIQNELMKLVNRIGSSAK